LFWAISIFFAILIISHIKILPTGNAHPKRI
jgi:hypothetical protein